MPANKVLASFGNLGELETQNLKLAVKASREGRSVVLRTETATTAVPKVRRNLAFLDVATCLRTWQRWGLTELLDELAPSSKREVSFGDVVGALAIQRCVAPASKLEASRWYKTTALPELLGVSSRRFNNTRIHRALETLDSIEVPLQQKLARRIESQQGQFVSLFLDCTDTWFVGRGPELAKKRTTKEGLTRRRIGIALMCNEDGFPLRWATVSGDFNEPKTMLDMVDEVSGLSWADKLPVVVDRAMGRGVTVEALLARDVHFVTAVPSPEIAKHSTRIPVGCFDDVDVSDDDETRVRKELGARALEAGFVLSGDRYLFDLGLFTKGEGGEERTASWLAPSRALAALRLARRARVDVDTGETIERLAERYGCNKNVIHRALVLNGLIDELQERVLAGEADRITPGALRAIAKLPTAARQRTAFEEARLSAGDGPALKVTRELARLCSIPDIKLRGAVVFSPTVFVNTRRALNDAIAELERAVQKANEHLRSNRHRAKREAAIARVAEVLKRYKLRDVYRVACEDPNDGETLHQLRLERDDRAWARKRALDGLSLIIAHPEVKLTADELVARYFAKDKVEKDFQAIKSVLELRPINHQTDPKVRAHVTLCVLALLLERAIEHQLRAAGLDMTGPCAVHLLKTAKLNLYAGDVPIYSATQPDPEQRRILDALRLQDLTDDDLLTASLTPRA